MGWLRILDVLSAVITVVSLWHVAKSPRWWLVYTFGNILFIIITVYAGLVGQAIMGVFLLVTALKNYWVAKKERRMGDDSPADEPIQPKRR
jgi:hypothetical protein